MARRLLVRPRMFVRWAAVALFVPLLAGEARGAPVRWRLAPGVAGIGEARALAVDARSGRLALGDDRGVLLGSAPETLQRAVRRGPVSDLAFLPDGTLLVATDRGLFHLDAAGRVSDRSPAPGTRARQAIRILARDGLVLVGTQGGAFVSRDGRSWQRLDAALPEGPVEALGLRARGERLELWLIVDGEVWRATLAEETPRVRVESPLREIPFTGSVGRPPRDLLMGAGDAEVVVLSEDRLAVRTAEGSGWEQLRLALPAGAVAQRLARAGGFLWIATDRGLLFSESPPGPWHRAAGPGSSAATWDVEEWGGRLYAVGEAGLLVGEVEPIPAAEVATREARSSRAPALGPGIHAVQHAALDYLELTPVEIHRLRRGLRRRGWLPTLDLRLARERRRTSNRARDEVFTSGALRHLYDHDSDRMTDYEVAVVLSWDLGDVAYHAEEIDVSKEAREILELRDDVLDEVNQLFYERRRVILELASTQPDALRAEELRLRSEELAAGLDAWTGGWFRRQLERASREREPPRPSGDQP